MTVDILIVDDDEMFRRAAKQQLEAEEAFRVVGEATDGESAIQMARMLRPEMILMDIGMPRLNGLEATRRIKAEHPETKVIMLTIHEGLPYRRAADESGADAYVLKKNFKDELYSTLRRVKRSSPSAYWL